MAVARVQKQRIVFEVVRLVLTTDTSRVVFRTAVRLARMMSRVLRLGQGSMMENRMLSTRITRLTVSLNMFNLLHELEEERNSFLLVIIWSKWNGRERRRRARGLRH